MRQLFVGTAVLLPFVLSPILGRGKASIALVVVFLAGTAAWFSPALPVALEGLPSVLVGLTGSNPLPSGGTVVMLAMWSALGVLVAIWRKPDRYPLTLFLRPPIALSVVLGVWMIVRLGASPVGDYGGQKAELFVLVDVLAVIAAAVIARTTRDFSIFTVTAVIVAALASLALLRAIATGTADEVFTGRLSLSDDYNPIFLARSLAQGVILGVWFVASKRASPFVRLLCLASLPVFAVTLVATGSRGPLLALIVALIVLFAFLTRQGNGLRTLLVLVCAVAVSVVVVPQVLSTPAAVQRSLSIFSDAGSGLSDNGRGLLWSDAAGVIRSHPVSGLGTGGFAEIQPVERYPHNLFLEVGAELGGVGLVLVCGILASTIVCLRRAWATGDADARMQVGLVAALFAAALVDANLSGDITGNRGLWLASGLATGLAWRVRDTA